MSEGDSIGESVHGKPSVVYRFFSRLGQVGFVKDFSDSFRSRSHCSFLNSLLVGWVVEMLKSIQKIYFEAF